MLKSDTLKTLAFDNYFLWTIDQIYLSVVCNYFLWAIDQLSSPDILKSFRDFYCKRLKQLRIVNCSYEQNINLYLTSV